MTVDTTIVVLDRVPHVWLDSLAQDRAFAYATAFRPESLWQRFIRWLAGLFGETLEQGSTAIDTFLWIVLAVLVMGILVIWIRHGSRTFGKRNVAVRGSAGDVEDIAADDIDKLIGQEVAAKRWRSAVRYLYLRTLQDLQSAGLIVWKKDKTNRDYLREVAEPNTHAAFAHAVLVFESSWYGDEVVSEGSYQNAQSVYDAVRQTLRATT